MRLTTSLCALGAVSTMSALSACGGGSAPVTPLPTAALEASSTTLDAGGAATLTWSSTNATSCSASGGWSGTLDTSGTKSTGALGDDTTFSLTCTGAGGASQPATVTIVVNAAPTATLSANPTTVTAGGASLLTWSSAHATACLASGNWSGTLAASGSQSTGALTANSSFSLTCSGPGGTSPAATASVTVNALPTAPTASVTASPSSVVSGGSSTLTWSSANATSCTASGGWSGTLAASGSRSTGPLAATTAYSLVCSGAGGTSLPATATVSILPIPTATLSAVPTAISAGGTSTLSWSSTNATSCTASGGWTGSLAASGSRSTGPVNAATTYTLICSGAGGTSAPATATVNLTPSATLSVYPSVITTGGSSTLTWSSSNAAACVASGGWSGALGTGGTQSTGAVSATTTYSLICSGPGGSSTPVSAKLTVSSVTMSLAPTAAAITLTRTQQFTATVPGGGAATWTVDGIANGNSTVGTISATGLYTAGSAGVHSIVATSIANSTQTASATVAVTDLGGVYTYHNDLSRDGANSQEYALTTANVATSFGKLASCAVDGAIYAQPLWVANVTISGAKHNVVFVATQHDSLFAFDADSTSCTQLWMVSLIDAAHGGTSGETPVPSTASDHLVASGEDIAPEIGVAGTPVIDPAFGILYVVSKSVIPAQLLFYQRLHAIDITTGNEKTGSPATINASVPGTGSGGTTVAFSAKQENQRPGLALANGSVYIAWASHEDSAPWYGWIMAYQYNGTQLTQSAAFNATPNTLEGGIWMSGGAPAVDSSGNVYVSTGNGTFDANSVTPPNNDYGDSLLQLTPSLGVTQYFTPSDEATLYADDEDFGAGGAALLADLPAGNTVIHALVCGGKDGSLYVLNRDLLGGLGDVFAVQKISLGHGIFSTEALWNGYLFVAPIGGALNAYQLTPSTVQFSLASISSHVYSFPGATPSVSASGSQNGLVWALDTNSYCTYRSSTCGPAVLHAYDATDLATELWNSSTNPLDAAGYAVKFTVPTVANGRVYVGTRGNNAGGVDSSTSTPGELDIYGLK
jgi:hypothetical protein